MVEGTNGRLGPVAVWGHLDRLTARDAARYAGRVEALGFDALWVPETAGREPFALLALLACATGRIRLGTSIASIYARDAVTMRAGAMTLQEASGGRFLLGLGVSHPHLVEKLRGHRYERPVPAMREYLAAYRSAKYRGPVHDPRPEPPVLLASLRERMLRLSAREADGAFPYLVTDERLASMRRVLDDATDGRRPLLVVTLPVVLETDPAAARETARTYLAPYLRTPNYQASWTEQGFDAADWEQPGSDRLVDAMIAWGDEDALRSRLAAMHDAGADQVALIPLARDGTTEAIPALEALAPAADDETSADDAESEAEAA